MSSGKDRISSPPLIRAVRDAGVVGEGGAGFPAHVKYGAAVEIVIANGCECEPLLYTDQRIMIENGAAVARGLKAVMAAVGAARGVIAIKAKYDEASRVLEGPAASGGMEIARIENFYPAGDEHMLTFEVTGRSIPPLGLPRDVGVLVANVGTLASVSRALDGKPVTRKMITVTGEVRRPAVLDVPIGAPLAACLEMCGGSTARDPVYLVGGPMMGRLIEDAPTLDRTPVTKTSGGLVVLPRGHFLHVTATLSNDVMRRRAATACIQCRYCTDLCPRYLVGHQFETHRVMRAFAAGDDEAQAVEQAWLCCECGVCELFACPMRLSPRRINSMLKAGFRQGGRSYAGAREIRPGQRDLRPYRKIPTTRLAMKTDIARYLDIHPEFASACSVDEVKIPLHQHTGAPAVPVVAAGDRVDAGDLIGEIPEGALGARVHASIRGVVTEVGASIVIKGA